MVLVLFTEWVFFFFGFVICYWCCEIEWVWVGVGLKSLDAAVHRSLPEIVVKKADQESVDKPLHPASLPLLSLFQNLVFVLSSALFYFWMIEVVCMTMGPFGLWENVGKHLKLWNLLSHSMRRDGLLHDSTFPFIFLWFISNRYNMFADSLEILFLELVFFFFSKSRNYCLSLGRRNHPLFFWLWLPYRAKL